MTDLGISMADLHHHFGPNIPQEVFDFVGRNRNGLTVRQQREVLAVMAKLYFLGLSDGRESLSEDDRQHLRHREALERLAERITKLERNA